MRGMGSGAGGPGREQEPGCRLGPKFEGPKNAGSECERFKSLNQDKNISQFDG